MSKTSKILLGVLVLLLSIHTFNSFDTKPEVHLWNWFGYNFGIAFTNLLVLKAGILIVLGGLYYDHKKERKTVNS